MLDTPEATCGDCAFLGADWGGVGFGGGEGEVGAAGEGAHEAGDEGGHYKSHEEDGEGRRMRVGDEGN